MMKRTALRDQDVRTLIRVVREEREKGLGPEEAFAKARALIVDAEDVAFDGWKAHVLEKAEEPGPAPATRLNVVERNAALEAELTQARRALAELGAKLEEASGGEVLRAKHNEALEEIDRLTHLNEKLNADLASARKDLEAAEELLKKPETKKHK